MQALVSVYDKTGVVEFSKILQAAGFTILSTGGTATSLTKEGVKVTQVSDVTEFPEILEGRVKTLHPRIHGGILARTDLSQHQEDLKKHSISPIQLVAVNLYPFVETVKKADTTLDVALENIDIGGHTLIRASAKNFKHVIIVCDPADYKWIGERIKEGGVSAITVAERHRLAVKAFQHGCAYDAAVSSYLASIEEPKSSQFPEQLVASYTKQLELRYGENPHQPAALYTDQTGSGIAHAQLLLGQPLSYNNILDGDAALRCIREFTEPACVIIKHNNPCGLAAHDDQKESYTRALSGDPVSAYGGIVGFNRTVTVATAEAMKGVFYELIIAPDYEPAVLDIFVKRPKLRVLKIPGFTTSPVAPEIKTVSGGVLLQTPNPPIKNEDAANWKVVTNAKATDEQLKDLLFAWKVSKHVKSNAIVLAKDSTLLGMGAGQPNRVQSIHLALKTAGEKAKGSVLASDAFMPFPDNVELAVQGGIVAIVQPGGSIRDQESIEAANKAGVPMLFTGSRNFLH
jgi:phosphoribosylaminoimidazolecarboxamide formyltransferase/IMP cyclohydrolase